MTSEALTALLAQQVMDWGIAPERFLMTGRRWIPRWRFQPTEKLEDAFRLLDAVDPDEYSITAQRGGTIRVRIRIGQTVADVQHASKAHAITRAVARVIGIDPGDNSST